MNTNYSLHTGMIVSKTGNMYTVNIQGRNYQIASQVPMLYVGRLVNVMLTGSIAVIVGVR